MKNINTRDGTKIEDKKTKIKLPAGIAGTYLVRRVLAKKMLTLFSFFIIYSSFSFSSFSSSSYLCRLSTSCSSSFSSSYATSNCRFYRNNQCCPNIFVRQPLALLPLRFRLFLPTKFPIQYFLQTPTWMF